MELSQNGGVCGVIVDGDVLAEDFALKARNQILADETCGAGDDNFSC